MSIGVDSLDIRGMSVISFEIMLSAVESMDYYYGNKKHFDIRKQEAISWLEEKILYLRQNDIKILKKNKNT